MRNQEKLLQEDIASGRIGFLFSTIESVLGVSQAQIRSKSRLREIAFARNIMGYIVNIKLGHSVVSTGKVINRDHSTISHYSNTLMANLRFEEFREKYDAVSHEFFSNCANGSKMDYQFRLQSIQKRIDRLEYTKEQLLRDYYQR